MNERYSAKEAAAALEISPATLGKYVMALEGAGFRFETGKRNARLFDEKELATLRRMMDTAASENMPPGQAANMMGQNAFLSIIDSRLCALEEQQTALLKLHAELDEKIARLPVPQRIPDYSPPPFLSFPLRKAGFLRFLSK
ncbi:hypothetical protein BTO30_11640 [Domibacillus antri]|uniref:HTH merR-type domain-containing protein n=1 Tax=Domibacillus antri TaxID=1714264 RepID=A0A1Q8Q3Z1_9BACI|nr:hypothetical protein [Domibacillus antri]OLN22064.1 hypothetical protein BTO30_11640 [Domibacillus antri]